MKIKETCIACGKERIIFDNNVCKKCFEEKRKELNDILPYPKG